MFLAKVAPDHIVTRLDIVLDFACPTSEAGQRVVSHLLAHLTQPYRGRRKLRAHLTTTYFGVAGTRRTSHCTMRRLPRWTVVTPLTLNCASATPPLR